MRFLSRSTVDHFHAQCRRISGESMVRLIPVVLVVLFLALFSDASYADSLTAQINPSDVRDEARWNLWRYNGGIWGDRDDPGNYVFHSGPFQHNHVESGLSNNYMVVFTDVNGYSKPADIFVGVGFWWGGNKTRTGTYTTTATTTTATTTTATTTTATTTTATTTAATTTTTTTIPGAACVDISQTPLDTQLQAAPATIMFVIDDSGSMDWEILSNEADGLFHVGNSEYGYLFSGYSPSSDNLTNTGVSTLDDDRPRWKSQWAGYNKMYYNPQVTYNPWPNHSYSNASTTSPRSNPEATSPTLTLSNTFMTISGSSGAPVILDNGETGYVEAGSWTGISSQDLVGGTGKRTTSTSATATWTVALPESGTYEVFARWNDDNSNDADANYTITRQGGATTVERNQSSNQGQWVSLGDYSFGSTGIVVLRRDNHPEDDYVVADAIRFVKQGESISIKNSHYFTWNDANQDGVRNAGEDVYLVNLSGTDREYYLFADSDSDDYVDGGELTEVLEAGVPAFVKPKSSAEDLQNFANWFSYYRRREFTGKNAVANVITGLSGVRVGYYGINGSITKAVRPVNVTMGTTFSDSTSDLLADLYGINSNGSTPLRSGLKKVGDYMSGTGTSPFNTSPYYSATLGGACQQSFAIVMTDGYWGAETGFDIGNQDGGMGYPYQDTHSNTLADVAMKYYKTDLSSGTGGLQNLAPTNFPDLANWQHMVTYAVAFGLTGQLNPDDYDFYNSNPASRTPITWPNPSTEGNQTKIDDLWHATVNGRGEYLSAANPEELTSALLLLAQSIASRIGSGASVSINGEEIHAGSTIFQSSYKSDNWTGDVKAYSIIPSTGAVGSGYLWSAQGHLESRNWDTGRVIATYDGTTGIAFRYASLSSTQKLHLDQNQVNYLRGNDALEVDHGGPYRNRSYRLGDIVHSTPVYHKNFIFAGGNDGMLHAFNASTGQEVFAYVPNLVFPNLAHLTSPGSPAYVHKFYVDQSPYIKEMGVKDLLVCGLGAGGKGYFCLDVTTPADNTESNVNSWIEWEYPKPGASQSEIDDLGLSFSQAFIVNSNVGWVVIFGNGYNSIGGQAALYILNAEDGSLRKKIDVGGTCNGLSTPAVIDVNNDFKVDYVYAGDLAGNMWKFDLTGQTETDWDVAYKSGSTPKPFFQAKDASGTGQPITTKPDIMLHCDKTKPGYMVLFGTGKYLGDSDFSNTQTQTIYGIWDYGDDADDSEFLGGFNRGSGTRLSNQPNTVSLLEQTQKFFGLDPGGSSTFELRVISDNVTQWKTVADRNGTGVGDDPSDSVANHAGWYFDLPISKERVIRNVIIRDGKLIVISSIPKTSPCEAGGDSILHEMDACSGGRLSDPQFDINNDGVIDDNDMITITVDGETITVPPTGIEYPGMIYEPIVLWQGQWETKYFSTSRGEIIMLKEAAERRGINYWREIE